MLHIFLGKEFIYFTIFIRGMRDFFLIIIIFWFILNGNDYWLLVRKKTLFFFLQNFGKYGESLRFSRFIDSVRIITF